MHHRIAALFAAVCVAAIAGCQPPPVESDDSAEPQPTRTEPAIYVYGFGDDANASAEKLLESNVPELRLRAVQFESVIAFLRDLQQVNIVADWRVMAQLGITRDTEVTLTLRNVAFRVALESVLTKVAGRQGVLDYMVRDGVIKVSAREDINTYRCNLIYDVDDLFRAIPAMTGEQLIHMIRIYVLLDSWAPTGDSSIWEVDHLLVINQTIHGHREVRRFLELLRRASAARSDRLPLATKQNAVHLDVIGIDALRARPEAVGTLAVNGFVITAESAESMADLYDHQMPVFVTTDAMLHAYNVLFGESFKDFERRQADRFIAWQRGLWQRVSAARPGLVTPEQMTRLRGLVAVGMMLADPKFKPGGVALPDWVDQEVARASAASATARSAAWKRTIAYSTFRPRGIYAGDEKLERFFRARIWWSRYPFRGEVAADLALAAELGRLLAADRAGYAKHDEPYAQMLGRSAGADVLAFHDAVGAVAGKGEPEPADLKKAAERLAKTAGAKIGTGDAPDDLRGPGSLSIYVLSSRYTFAGEVFTMTTPPRVNADRLPGGLDLMAALGGDLARRLDLEQTPEPAREQLAEALSAARDVREDRRELIAPMIQQRDRALRALLSPEVTDRHPPFMRSEAYPLKSLQTALAGWAESRHVWQLHALESSGFFGEGTPPPNNPPAGIVEPNVEFWKQFTELVAGTRKALQLAGPVPRARKGLFDQRRGEDDRWPKLAELSAQCLAIAKAQLAGKELTRAQKQFFASFDDKMADFARTGGDRQSQGDPVVAFIHRDVGRGDAVHVGTGFPQAIYAICEHRGRKWLCKGGALTYREHATSGQVLNDADWLKMLRGRDAPAGPAWSLDFCPPADPPAGE